jgi:hypothetical protein
VPTDPQFRWHSLPLLLTIDNTRIQPSMTIAA